MALQTSGSISLLDIAYEFNDTAPHALSEFYGVATGVPTSGEITLADFYGVSSSFYPHQIDQSLRLNDDDSAYLSRTPASGSNRQVMTLSFWAKRGNLTGATNSLWGTGDGTTNNRAYLFFDSNDKLYIISRLGGGTSYGYISDMVFRDTSAWYHIVIQINTTESAAADRCKFWVNGTQISTTLQNGGFPSSYNTYFNVAKDTRLGHIVTGSAQPYFDGYLAEVHFIDGAAYDASSFGETKSGVWIPKAYSGSYGTNGFYLDFDGTYYNDKSGNGNNFTANNLAATDVVLDSPTNNFATLNVLDKDPSNATLSQGNLDLYRGGSDWGHIRGTMGVSSGKWYWEFCIPTTTGGSNVSQAGVCASDTDLTIFRGNHHWEVGASNGFYIVRDQSVYNGSTITLPAGTIIQVAVDMDNQKLWLGKNNTWYGSSNEDTDGNPSTGANPTDTFVDADIPDGNLYPYCGTYNNDIAFNAGQDSSFAGNKTAQGNTDDNGYGDFYYAPPTGYLALCTANLTLDAAMDPINGNSPQDYFNTVLYTGNGTNGHAITGVGFQPDMVWIKARSAAYNHCLTDAVRGFPNAIFPDITSPEGTTGDYSNVQSFDADGFTLDTANIADLVNGSGVTHAAWNWKANGSGVSNTDGSITSTVSANTDAGFSIVSYTGNGTNGATVGHGLSSAPEMMVCKNRTGGNWQVWHTGIASGSFNYIMNLNSSAAAYSGITNRFQAASSSTFTIGTDIDINDNGDGYVTYCFHSVEGFSKFGSYTGNGSTDGTFVYTGFRPAFVLLKRTDTSASWPMLDSVRDPYNVVHTVLEADGAYTEYAAVNRMDFLANGFKLRDTNSPYNASGGTYIYMAFAENPFKYANAR